MRSRKIILVVFAFLALSAAYILLTDPWSTTGDALSRLMPDVPGNVQTVQMIGGMDTLEFVRREAEWYLEDEQLERKAVENLLYATERMTITSITDLSVGRDEMQFTEVIYIGKKRVEGHFLLVSTAAGLLVSPPGSTTAYGVELKGFEDLSLEKVFSMNPDHYRKHLIVDLLPSEISVVKVDPLDGTSFMAVQDEEGELVVTDQDSGEEVTGSVSEQKVRMLFSYFNAIRYEKALAKDSIAAGTLKDGPMAVIEVESSDGGFWKFEVYPYMRHGAVHPDLFKGLVKMNDGPGYLLVNYYYLDLLMRGLEQYGYVAASEPR